MHYTNQPPTPNQPPMISAELTTTLTGTRQTKLLAWLVWRPGLSYKIENSNTHNCITNLHEKKTQNVKEK